MPTPPPQTGPLTLLGNILADFGHLPAWQNLEPLALGSTLALAVHPFDREVNSHLAGKGVVDAVFRPGTVIGHGAFEAGAAGAVYLIGREAGHDGLAALGMALLRAQAVNGALTEGLKAAARRQRPNGSARTSFPSGHTSATFASATVLARRLGWKVAVPAYLVASYVGVSRLHENAHYASDVVFGATLGVIAGATVTRHGRSNFAVTPVVMPGGMAVMVTRIPGVKARGEGDSTRSSAREP